MSSLCLLRLARWQLGDGSYMLEWFSDKPGAFTVYVKVDRVHVLNSPARMVLAAKDASPA